MFTTDTNSLILQAISIIFYIALAVFTLASALALYSLIRYSKAKLVVIAVSATYIILALALFFIATGQLHRIEL